jgi:hypothetical protein
MCNRLKCRKSVTKKCENLKLIFSLYHKIHNRENVTVVVDTFRVNIRTECVISELLGFWTLAIVRNFKELENTALQKRDTSPSSGDGREILRWIH